MTAAPITVRRLGVLDYGTALARMRAFTDARTPSTGDEAWLLEHPPVYTLGVRARHRRLAAAPDVPVVVTDRGGDVTYHGPGQPIVYVLIDLVRRGLDLHYLVRTLEQATIEMLATYGLTGIRRPGAPGVYVDDRKIASLGLRVRGGRTYHGLAFNARLDLAPFHAIDPCGYPGLRLAQLADWLPDADSAAVGEQLLGRVLDLLGYTEAQLSPEVTSDSAHRLDARP